MQKAFSFDINKCTGCEACHLACRIENELDPHVRWRQVNTFNAEHHPGIPSFHLSLACNHCIDAPCMKSCPALAYTKDPTTGSVTIKENLCIGCRYCTWACPYDAPQFNAATGVVEKCTFCAHRLDEGLEPACVTACPTGALKTVDGFDGAANSEPPPGFPSAAAEPAIEFVGLEEGRGVPDASAAQTSTEAATGTPRTSSAAIRISLRGEWVLAAFTLLASVLVAVFASTSRVSLPAGIAFLAAGGVGIVFSTLHLGRRERAYRAVLNWRNSWLSREVILYGLFLASSAAVLLVRVDSTVVHWLVTIIGLVMLFAMDRVYHVTRTRGLDLHSARVLMSGLFLAGAFAAQPILFFGFGAGKTILYLDRKRRFQRDGSSTRPALSFLRVALGLVVPTVVWIAARDLWWFAVAGVLLAEAIDRCEFYVELEAPTLAEQTAHDLDVALAIHRQA